MNEAGGNVALIANNPRHIPGGRVLPLADFTDLYPTFCELAGVPLDAARLPDGRSFARFLIDEKAPPHRDWILNEYHTTRVVRDTRFKLYSEGSFFDANADPDEQHDLSSDSRLEIAAARSKLSAVLASLPPDKPEPFPLRSQSGFKIRTELRAKRN